MKTDRDMLEKLGYKRLEDCVNPSYCKKGDPWTWVKFCNNGVEVSTQNGLGYKYLSCEIIDAIYEKMKELGRL